MKLKVLFLAIVLTYSFLIKAQVGDQASYYSQALEYLKGESPIGKPDKRYTKLRVSSQLVDFDVLGWFLQSEVSKKISGYVPKSKFSDDDFRYEESFEKLTDDLKKSKCQLFFSEIKDDLLLAEVIKESNSSDYRSATIFGEGMVYLFEFVNGKLERVISVNVHHN